MNTHFITSRPYSDKMYKDDLDRYEIFLDAGKRGRIDGWSARKTFEPGDLAIFYFAQPLMTIVAVTVVDSDPYIVEIDSWADFSNAVFCDFAPVWVLENKLPIKEAIARQPLIGQWWKTKPYQGIRRIDPAIAQSLLQEIAVANPGLRKKMELLAADLTAVSAVPPPQSTTVVAGTSTPTAHPKPAVTSKKKKWTMRDLMRLSWQEFETLVCELYSHIYEDAHVETTPPRADFGVDVKINDRNTGQLQIVQCKRYRRDNKVSSVDMQKFGGAMKKFKATRGYFVTSSSFNRFAREYVNGMDDIELVEGKQLLKMINNDDSILSIEEFRRTLHQSA